MDIYIYTYKYTYIYIYVYIYIYALPFEDRVRAPSFAFGRMIFRAPGDRNLLKHVKKFWFYRIYVEPCIMLAPIKGKLRYPSSPRSVYTSKTLPCWLATM